jgi:hypothetical protein
MPASYIAFDLLALDGVELLERPFSERRAALELDRRSAPRRARARRGDAERGSSTPRASSPKRLDAPTPRASERRWSRSSAVRTIDCVSSATARARRGHSVGSLILGLYEPTASCASSGTARASTRPRSASSSRGLRLTRRARAAAAIRAAGPRSRPRVGRAAPGARRRGELRPRQRRAHPPRHEDPALARGQAAARLPL